MSSSRKRAALEQNSEEAGPSAKRKDPIVSVSFQQHFVYNRTSGASLQVEHVCEQRNICDLANRSFI